MDAEVKLSVEFSSNMYVAAIPTLRVRGAVACRSEGGLIVDTLPMQTEPSLPPLHMHTNTHASTNAHTHIVPTMLKA